MPFKVRRITSLLAVLATVAIAATLACESDAAVEPAPAAAPQPAAAALPAAPAAAAPVAAAVAAPRAPAAPQAAAAAAPARAAAAAQAASGSRAASSGSLAATRTGTDTVAAAAFKYVAPTVAPGDYPDHNWTGPAPTTYNESPWSARLVREGKIPPVMDRVPGANDVWVIAPYDEIGVYGGEQRITSHHVKTLDHLAVSSMVNGNPRGNSEPRVIKSWDISQDGRVYTFKLRNGMRWSDGYPMTIEDARFGLEDLMMNQGEINSRVSSELISQITGNPATYATIDNETFTITYDDPYFALAESRGIWGWSKTRGCPRCMYAPAHMLKRFHPKYNAAELPALMKEYEKESPSALFSLMRNVRSGPGLDWRQTAEQPKIADPNYVYKGKYYTAAVTELIQTDCCDGGRGAERNHYFWAVDPEGNQLPYIDKQRLIKLESREAAMFRGMNGETDYYGGSMILSEMPLYVANMEKGDYSIHIFRSPAGNDGASAVQQEFTKDAEMGHLLRTKDFRKALSIATDRDAMNMVTASGIMTPQQWMPHPQTPYFAGQEWADKDAAYDLDGAKALMTKMGYSDKNGDGLLDRKDGKGPLSLDMNGSALNFPQIEVLKDHWAKLGVRLDIKEAGCDCRQAEPETGFEHHFSLYGMNLWAAQWSRSFAGTNGSANGAQMGGYWASFGKEGMAPSGGDPIYQDAYGNQAPAGNYAADITGNIAKMQDMWRTGLQTGPLLDPTRVEMGKEYWRISADEKYNIGYLAFGGIFRGMTIKRNNHRNIPKNHVALESKGILGSYYFEDGIDNMNHPGNKSKKYKSVHFLDPEYWTQ